MTITVQEYLDNGNGVWFEVGFNTPEPGCDYVVNPTTGDLQRIVCYQTLFSEGVMLTSVQTYDDQWHEVDGGLLFAKSHQP